MQQLSPGLRVVCVCAEGVHINSSLTEGTCMQMVVLVHLPSTKHAALLWHSKMMADSTECSPLMTAIASAMHGKPLERPKNGLLLPSRATKHCPVCVFKNSTTAVAPTLALTCVQQGMLYRSPACAR